MSAPLDGPLYSIRRDLLASSALTPASSAPLRLNGTASAGRSAERKSGTDESAEILQQSRTSDQDQAYRALYGDGGFSSHERMLKQAAVENRQNVLSASCVELFRLAERAGISHVAVADWATLQGQIFSIADDDQLQQVIVEAKEQTQHNTQDPCEPATESKNLHEPELVMRCMADVEPEKIEWLWPGRIAIGKQTLIGGEPGLGKSQITAALAATVTTGGAWPCEEGRAPLGSVIILSAEDDASDTIRPRLDAAGADVRSVYIVTAVRQGHGRGRRTFNLQADLQLLEQTILQIGNVRLVIIDPVSSYLGKIDSHKNAEVRGTLEPLGVMASRLRVAVVSITHFSKGAGQSAVNSFIGSIAFVAAARAAFIVTRDPDNADPARRLFVQAKNNLAPDAGGLAFRVEQRLVGKDIVASATTWEGERITRTADEILSAGRESMERPERTEAEDFLRDVLADGPRPSTEIEAEAKGAGISWRTVRRAQKTLRIEPYRKAEVGDGLGKSGRWYWSLPNADEAPMVANFAYLGHVPDVDTLGNSGHLSRDGGDQ
jgi:putative DNA primase/helicase